MGWASSSEVMADLIKVTFQVVPSATARMRIYLAMIESLEAQDGDTLDECVGLDEVYDEALRCSGYDDPSDPDFVFPTEGAYGGPLVRPESDKNTFDSRMKSVEERVSVVEAILAPAEGETVTAKLSRLQQSYGVGS